MNKDLYDDIVTTLQNRSSWENKQEGFYRLRFGGIRRTNKPYPTAPDMHYPLADSTIDKLKPLFIQQLYANDTLAQFISTQEQSVADTQAASEWFDYQMKQCSNFEMEIFSSIDQMLEAGSQTIKCYFDTRKKYLCFSGVDSLHIVVPKWTEDIQDADWLVHILQLSEAQYRKNPNYDQDPELIKSIKGKKDSEPHSNNVKEQLRDLREGLAYGSEQDQIVLWEVYRRSDSGPNAKWVIDTISPVKGWETPIRPSFGLPYDHGQLPFFRIRAEITKKGYYTARGVPEIQAPFQMSLKKMWDGQLQFLDFFGIPTYENSSSTPLPNGNNYKATPGGILPPGVTASRSQPAPMDFDKQMAMTRAIAEDRIAIPDLGNNQHLTGGKGQSDRVTATQINAVVGLSGQNNDMRARIFRLDLAVGYKMAWALLNQYKRDELQYVIQGDIKTVDPRALHTKYVIMPNGSPDSWNKGGQMQKALMRFQMLSGSPFVNQGELVKRVLELDDSRLVKRLYTDPGAEQEAQAEQQAQEISIMLLGYPAAVSEADDDKTHLITLAQFIERRLNTGEKITPEQSRLFLMHGSGHLEGLKNKKDPALQQITQQLMPVVQILEQLASQPDAQPQGQATPIPQGSGGPTAAPPNSSPAPDPQEQALEEEKVAIQAGNMLVNMSKAGMPVSQGELNTILRKLGLPDLPMKPIHPVTSVPREPVEPKSK